MCIRDRSGIQLDRCRKMKFMKEDLLAVTDCAGNESYIDLKAVSYTHLDVYKRQVVFGAVGRDMLGKLVQCHDFGVLGVGISLLGSILVTGIGTE